MSGNTFTCRDRYFNYGSYLRSRGYDKEICNLIVAIEQGQFPIGPIYPGSCSNPRKPTTIKGNVDIVPCEATDNNPTPISGQLTVTGGYIGAGGIDISNGTNIPSLVAQQALGFGIQSLTGISSNGGPIYQQTDCNHSNWFGASNHVFVGGVGGSGAQDCSTNVYIRGNLFVDGSSIELGGFIGETLTLIQGPGNNALGTINTFKNETSNGNMVDMYASSFTNVSLLSGADQWKNYLAFAVDGNSDYTQIDVSGIDASGGMSNVMGHMRGFRGLTITNPPYNTPVDIEWNPDISGTNRAIDAYGSIRVQPGNTDGTGSSALGNIDISGGQFRIFQNDISNVVLFSNGDASFNGRVSCYDLSVTNIATFGASTTYIDTSNVNTSYVTVDNSLNTKFIYTPSSNDMYINAGSGGSLSDIYMNANNIFMDSDLSVNDISSSNINNTGLINTNSINAQSMIINDISTNHISVYDLSVTNLLVVDGDISANDHISGIDISASGIVSSNKFTNLGQPMVIDSVNSNLTLKATNRININPGSSPNNVVVFNGDISANGAISGVSFTDGIATLSAGDFNATTVTASGLVTAGSGIITDLSVNTLQSTVGADLKIKAGITGLFQDIYMNANNIFMDSDLSVNDISSSNINNTGLINTTSIIAQSMTIDDISTNHISVYDLSVTNFLVVDGDISANGAISGVSFTDGIATLSAGALSNALTIQATSGEFTDISVNTHASIYDLSVVNMHTVGTSTTTIDTNSIQANSGEFIDISVNSHASIYDLSVGNITINNTGLIETYDLSVNNHAYIYDLSVNGDSVFTGNFLINNITGGSEAITIQTNHGTNEKITIQTLQGQSSDSININSTAGGVNISAGTDITFSASNIIMSNSDLSAGDISANNIQALGYITSGGDINTASSINALSANITDLLTAGSGNISDLSVNTLQSIGNDLTIKAGITGARDITFSASDIIMSNSDLSAGDISANNIQALGYITTSGAVTGGSLTDGTATLSSGALIGATTVTASGAVTGGSLTDGTATLNAGALTGLTTVTASGNVTALNFTLDSGSGGNLFDLSNNVTILDASVNSLQSSVNLLDASMAFVEETGFIRMRKTNAQNISNVTNLSTSTWTEIDLNFQDHQIGGITHNGSTEFKIAKKGLYSYNIQLSLTTGGVGFTVDNLELALTNGGNAGSSFPTVPATLVNYINKSGSNINGGFNKEFSEQHRAFLAGQKCFISGNGVGHFEADDRLRIYLRWSSSTVGPHTFDTNDPDGTIVTFTLIQALE